MTTKAFATTLVALAGVLTVAQAQTTQTNAAPEAPVLSPTEQTIQDIKNPVSWLTWGGDLRVRNEYFNNAQSIVADSRSPLFGNIHEQDYFRFRGRVWTSLMPVTNLTLNARLASEPREFLKESSFDTFADAEGPQYRYGIIDNLNLQWKQPMDLPVVMTVGRQDIFMGDGWLVGDGTPNDGSFSYFLDSARMTVDLKEQKTTIDLIGICQYARPDAWLPTIGPSTTSVNPPGSLPFTLTDQDEKGAILWVANKSIPELNVDGYFIYKHDTRLNDPPSSAAGLPTGLLFGDNADIYTLGGRLSGVVQEHWQYFAEGAYQFGQKQDPFLNGFAPGGNNPLLPANNQTSGFRNIDAIGAQSKIAYLFKDKLNTQVGVSYEFLSGDNPKSKNDEMFDVLWGRWPQWSELYNVYSYVQETRVGQTANLQRIGPTFSFEPAHNMNFSFNYFAMFADQDVPTRSDILTGNNLSPNSSPFSNTGNFRGHYMQAVLKYKFNRHLSGHLWAECVLPGDFYNTRETMSFLRAELLYTF